VVAPPEATVPPKLASLVEATLPPLPVEPLDPPLRPESDVPPPSPALAATFPPVPDTASPVDDPTQARSRDVTASEENFINEMEGMVVTPTTVRLGEFLLRNLRGKVAFVGERP
jgi:hypothetical protein